MSAGPAEVSAHWPFVGVKLGSNDACHRRGVWEQTGQCTEDGAEGLVVGE